MTLEEATRSKFEHILHVIKSDDFLNMSALGGEIPFWIAPYNIEANSQVENEIKNLINKLNQSGLNPLLVDLFEVSCSLIESNIGLDQLFELEQEMDKEDFKDALQSIINVHERFIPEIVRRVENHSPNMLLIKGVGSVFPFIRSHTILNNLQSAVRDIPTVMFFCGSYTGEALNLFGMLKDDNYYRAFDIDTFKLKS